MKTTSHAQWSGTLKEGQGSISTESGAIQDLPYNFGMRFEGDEGTNPEELIGAAHAGCFSMALSKILGDAGVESIEEIKTKAHVTLDQKDGGFAITKIHLKLEATLPGTDEDTFMECANTAKDNCPVSKVLNADITLDAKLVG